LRPSKRSHRIHDDDVSLFERSPLSDLIFEDGHAEFPFTNTALEHILPPHVTTNPVDKAVVTARAFVKVGV
jgi:hypothetical protein